MFFLFYIYKNRENKQPLGYSEHLKNEEVKDEKFTSIPYLKKEC